MEFAPSYPDSCRWHPGGDRTPDSFSLPDGDPRVDYRPISIKITRLVGGRAGPPRIEVYRCRQMWLGVSYRRLVETGWLRTTRRVQLVRPIQRAGGPVTFSCTCHCHPGPCICRQAGQFISTLRRRSLMYVAASWCSAAARTTLGRHRARSEWLVD